MAPPCWIAGFDENGAVLLRVTPSGEIVAKHALEQVVGVAGEFRGSDDPYGVRSVDWLRRYDPPQ